MEYTFTEEYHNLLPVEIFTLVIAEQQNISNIRALVEKYTDDFEHNDHVKSVEGKVLFQTVLLSKMNIMEKHTCLVKFNSSFPIVDFEQVNVSWVSELLWNKNQKQGQLKVKL